MAPHKSGQPISRREALCRVGNGFAMMAFAGLVKQSVALAAGLDLYAAVPEDAPTTLAPGGRATIPTGIAISLPPGSEGQVRGKKPWRGVS